jgi:hypothetical protein
MTARDDPDIACSFSSEKRKAPDSKHLLRDLAQRIRLQGGYEIDFGTTSKSSGCIVAESKRFPL